jgi:hypothetical protein
MITIQEGVARATAAHRSGDLQTARVLYDQIIAEREDLTEVLACLGTLYAQSKDLGHAIVFLKYALTLNPKDAATMGNLATVYRMMDNSNASIEWNMKSIAIDPDNPATLSNLAGSYINNGTPLQALAWANAALEKAPDMAEAQNHRALALLELGRFDAAWVQYDGRFGVPQWHRRPYQCPQWAGEPTRLLAISGEQGLGDEVMFLTCIAQVRGLVDGIVLEVSPRLVKLMQNSFPDIPVYGTCEALLDEQEPTAWTHMGSVPKYVWPVQPNAYLKPTGQYPRHRRRIGISWRGGTMTTHERLRNFQLDYWKHLIAGWPAEVISLQYGDRAGDAKTLGIEHDGPSIADLDQLAAMIKSCDLVVSVTNTTVHMAGALGVPCISLVPSKPDWRCGQEGERMIWYDSVQMVRQRKGEDWRETVDRVRAAVAEHFPAMVAA